MTILKVVGFLGEASFFLCLSTQPRCKLLYHLEYTPQKAAGLTPGLPKQFIPTVKKKCNLHLIWLSLFSSLLYLAIPISAPSVSKTGQGNTEPLVLTTLETPG